MIIYVVTRSVHTCHDCSNVNGDTAHTKTRAANIQGLSSPTASVRQLPECRSQHGESYKYSREDYNKDQVRAQSIDKVNECERPSDAAV